MTLDEAIEIKLRWRKDNYPPPLADEMNADMLSIEALKRVRFSRDTNEAFYKLPLPGETRDTKTENSSEEVSQ